MAVSPSHKFGQIIGDVLEDAIRPLLERLAKRHGLYLDKKGERPCRNGRKCTWTDLNGNSHDLDFVLERGGTPHQRGTPVAFIETAWRRYTKHSRNKVQEIQGAIEPLAQTFSHAAPFKGAVLAGEFTEGALVQLQSLGFTVLFFPYQTVISAFKKVGIDAHYDENTPDAEFEHRVQQWNSLSDKQKALVRKELLKANRVALRAFMCSLEASLARRISQIIVLPLHGESQILGTIDEAIAFIDSYDQTQPPSGFIRYEIQIRFSNGEKITGEFNNKSSAIDFLRAYRPHA
ncbi:MAG: DNA methylase [Candidatus Hadarchaeum sp.]|uniref:DNA methylase n=1 Tax=Candidatus Hadarchaeum sp. TaxID=2883567 RepID=UPI003D098FD9